MMELCIVLPSSNRITSWFKRSDTVAMVIRWLNSQDYDMTCRQLCRVSPRAVLHNDAATLAESGLLESREILRVEQCAE
jgi:UBX domain